MSGVYLCISHLYPIILFILWNTAQDSIILDCHMKKGKKAKIDKFKT